MTSALQRIDGLTFTRLSSIPDDRVYDLSCDAEMVLSDGPKCMTCGQLAAFGEHAICDRCDRCDGALLCLGDWREPHDVFVRREERLAAWIRAGRQAGLEVAMMARLAEVARATVYSALEQAA